jgi:1-acyl-sn-glycerol-3-phosphate acyltransferase
MTTKQNPFTEQELQDMIDQFLAIEGPDEKSFARLNKFIEFYFSPTLFGLDNIPEGPTMFVGNHAMFGLDGMILMPTIYHQTGRFVRALADNAWFQSGTGTKMQKQGMVLANPEVCSALMERGEDLLIFPGGAAEANKTAEEKYSLVWRERTGFVRMAAQHGYNITPFGLVGPDEWFDHAMEGSELRNSWIGKLVQKRGIELREDIVPPIPKGMFNTLLPKPQRSYLAFGEPIKVPEYRDKKVPGKVQNSIRQETAYKVEGLIGDMLLQQAQQKHTEGRIRRFLTR